MRFLSLGGGEPLEWDGLFDALKALDGVLYRSFTTNGLLLAGRLDEVVRARPDKVHVSIHAPDAEREVSRAMELVRQLHSASVPSGVNLLVRRSRLEAARQACARLQTGGIGLERIVLLPWRGPGDETPTPRELGMVATGGAPGPFRSVACLSSCRPSARFVSVGADRSVAWCSYTSARRRLSALTWAALVNALASVGHEPCDTRLARDGDALSRPAPSRVSRGGPGSSPAPSR